MFGTWEELCAVASSLFLELCEAGAAELQDCCVLTCLDGAELHHSPGEVVCTIEGTCDRRESFSASAMPFFNLLALLAI